MAKDPDDFRNPQVSGEGSVSKSASSDIGKWIAIAVGALLLLLLLAWLFGLFENDEAETTVVPTDDSGAVVVTE